ncbi:hypothetical protein BC940DRAFT_316332 [Gongronella butleri]|nr:hypothetical protein BC940DRAFT_316332 [Gongronella butleri]
MDLSLLKLSLSGIVNIMRHAHYQRLLTYLPRPLPANLLDDHMDEFNRYGLSPASSALVDQVAEKVSSSDAIEDVLALLLELKKKHLGHNRHSQQYRLLSILKNTIETSDDWQQDDSEMTVYRCVAAIMDYLFRATGIKIVDGETMSNCTQSSHLLIT